MKCIHCGADTGNPKFCSMSCSASYNNRKFPKRWAGDRGCCGSCGCTLSRKQAKYCSIKCQQELGKRDKRAAILAGEQSFDSRVYKWFMMERLGNACAKCGWSEVHPVTGKVPIQLHHIDGNAENNSLDNLTLLCPNCHVLTDSFGNLNKGSGRSIRRLRYKRVTPAPFA